MARRRIPNGGSSGGARHRNGVIGMAAMLLGIGAIGAGASAPWGRTMPDDYVVFAQNDLGMHCMQRDYRHFMILPPYNTMQAVAIKRGDGPDIVEPNPSDFRMEFYIASNTTAIDKTNWWVHAPALLGADAPADVGLTGNRLSGEMEPDRARGLWEVTGVPVTPMTDAGIDNPYPLATIVFKREGVERARTQTVMPVSWEINCAICHGEPDGTNTDLDVLQDHDRLHGTDLVANAPVTCASCHADAALGAPGVPGVSTLSGAMHRAHADRLNDLPVQLVDSCYACHPGERAQCQRDVHLLRAGMTCTDCHTSMAAVGSPNRSPWVDEPRCADCHTRPGFEFEQPGTLFRNSVGHGGVQCWVCHGSPHAITPTVAYADNLQAMRVQGAAGTLSDCTVCHTQRPDEPFFHRVDD